MCVCVFLIKVSELVKSEKMPELRLCHLLPLCSLALQYLCDPQKDFQGPVVVFTKKTLLVLNSTYEQKLDLLK